MITMDIPVLPIKERNPLIKLPSGVKYGAKEPIVIVAIGIRIRARTYNADGFVGSALKSIASASISSTCPFFLRWFENK